MTCVRICIYLLHIMRRVVYIIIHVLFNKKDIMMIKSVLTVYEIINICIRTCVGVL